MLVTGLPNGGDDRSYVADLNNDGAADVVTTHKTSKTVLVFVNNGSGTLNSPATYTIDQEPTTVIASDITQDGVADLLFATGNASATSFMHGNGDGTFQAPFVKLINSAGTVQVHGVGSADVDSDGRKDVLLSDSYSGAVHLFRNFCPTMPTTTTLTSSKSSSLYNEYVSFTATVTTDDGGRATDHVLFMDGTRIIGAAPLSNTTPATATLFIQSLSAGDHVIKAVFEGTENYAPSSATITHTVTRLPFGAPQLFRAEANLPSSVSLQWVGTDDSGSFEISRMSGGVWTVLGTITSEYYLDSTVNPDGAYFYRVRAFRTGTGAASPYAPSDAAVLLFHTLPSSGMTIAASHVEQFRNSVNLTRGAAGLPAVSFTDPTLFGVTIKAIHLTELRDAAVQALAAAAGTTPSFRAITPGVTTMIATDLLDIWELVR